MISYGDYEARLLVGLVRAEERGDRHGSKLMDVCKHERLPMDEGLQQRFIEQNQSLGDSSGFSGGHLCFALNQLGRSRAEQVRDIEKGRTLWGKIRNVSRSDWIALGAFVVSVIALLKS